MIKYNVAIIGGGGYTASELIRLLINHEFVELKYVVSKSQSGKYLHEVHKDLIGETDLKFVDTIGYHELKNLQCLFLCLPHGESKKWFQEKLKDNEIKKLLIETPLQVIDMGNDFRVTGEIESLNFVYGMPEVNKNEIANAKFIANPGCFATAIQLGLMPIVGDIINKEVFITGVTGSTGAGRSLVETTNFNWRSNNFSPYKTFVHQHLHEIKNNIQKKYKQDIDIAFTPFRGNFTRGIFVTIVFKSELCIEEVIKKFNNFYSDSHFVFITQNEVDLKQVVNTNKSIIKIEQENLSNKLNRIGVHIAIDNLLKGASGQALQNFNIMNNIPETTGLKLKSISF